MSWTQPIDIYCERTDPSFWSEPVNAVTNAAFVLAGLAAFLWARQRGADTWTRVLCLWVVAIGIGSFLFHTFANRWSALADVIPIWTFVAIYVVYTLRRIFALGWPGTILALVIGIAASVLVMRLLPPEVAAYTNNATQYLPAVLALAVFAAAFAWAGRAGTGLVVAAGLVFALSLFFRSVDPVVCGSLPLGTHFLWHILNATMLGLLLVLAIRHGDTHNKSAPARSGSSSHSAR